MNHLSEEVTERAEDVERVKEKTDGLLDGGFKISLSQFFKKVPLNKKPSLNVQNTGKAQIKVIMFVRFIFLSTNEYVNESTVNNAAHHSII